mmetsp:Transcript_65221/g.116260  ORF Transcript_65221/g.116260 Transcript_65221/m.116260 type:complete len:305 (+) Transcript_65221:66-980(+)
MPDMYNLALVLAFAASGSHAQQVPAGTAGSAPLQSLAALLLQGDVAAAFNPSGSRSLISQRSSRLRSQSPQLSEPLLSSQISRRDAAKALVLLPSLALWPQRTLAKLDQAKEKADKELRKVIAKLTDLRGTQKRFTDFSTKLSKGKVRGDQIYDAQMVLTRLSIEFGQTQEMMNDTTVLMSKLEPSELERARALTTRFGEELLNIKKAARRQLAEGQINGAEEAGKALEEFFTVAASKYEVPGIPGDKPQLDTAAYYGWLGCEARGLTTRPGSNECVDARTLDGKRPRPDPNKKPGRIRLLPDQ